MQCGFRFLPSLRRRRFPDFDWRWLSRGRVTCTHLWVGKLTVAPDSGLPPFPCRQATYFSLISQHGTDPAIGVLPALCLHQKTTTPLKSRLSMAHTQALFFSFTLSRLFLRPFIESLLSLPLTIPRWVLLHPPLPPHPLHFPPTPLGNTWTDGAEPTFS